MKRLIGVLFFFVGALSYGQIPSAGLIGGWCFSGNANDNVGINHGTVFNATLTADRFGNPNSAYTFNGINSYIKAINAGPTGSLSRSVSFWAKTTNTTLTSAFCYGGSPGAFSIQFYYGCPGTGPDCGTSQYMRPASNIANGSWHHYVYVYDNTTGTQLGNIQIYMDGALLTGNICSGGTGATLSSSAAFPINFGKVADNNIRYFNGDLDDFYLYNRALTPSEVLALYNDTPCVGPASAPSTISGNLSVCAGASVVYSVAPVAGATSYTWTLPGGWTGTSNSNTITVTVGSNPGQITVATKNCCGASQPSTQDITVNPAPVLSLSATQFTICNGNSTTLTGNGASTYTWNSFVVAPSLVVSPTVSATYTLSGTNSLGCSSTITTNIVVTNNPLPTINVSGPGTSCPGQTVNLASNGASTYTWQPGNLNGFFVSVSPTVTTTYTVTGTNSNGCYNSASYTQSVATCAGINEVSTKTAEFSILPNPNNGTFELRYYNLKGTAQLEIYNSIGQLVYSKALEKSSEIINTKLSSGHYFVMIREENILKGMQKLVISN